MQIILVQAIVLKQAIKMLRYKAIPLVGMWIILVFSTSGCIKKITPSTIGIQDSRIATSSVSSLPHDITMTPDSNIVPVCRGNGKHNFASENSEISGTIIYQNFDFTGLYTLGGLPITSSQLLADETHQNVVFGFSLDGKWLAYSPINADSATNFEFLEIVLQSADGERIVQRLTTKNFDKELQVGHKLIGVSGYSYWINSELIYVTLYSQNPDPNTSGTFSNLPKVLNPFDAEWSNQYLDLPGRLSSQVFGISPDGTRALYEENGLSLWDYLRKAQIWHNGSLISPYRALINWRPDSSMVAYASLFDPINNEPVSLITRNGEYIPIVNKIFPTPGFSILSLSWSPDGKYLALAGRNEENLMIAIYDVTSKKYISQCPVGKLNGMAPSLAWSPNSSSIAISDIDSPILVFDLVSESVLELVQSGRVLGWSDKFPRSLP
jgi:WD40 repeat protein